MAGALGRPDLTPIHKPERAGDLKHSFADLARSRALLGYEPLVDFDAGLRETLAWYRSVYG
jgi:nucleoside-diphosphate-sugar epimerase